jgi:hypothetical protein
MPLGRRSALIAIFVWIPAHVGVLASCRDRDAPVPAATPPDLAIVSRGAEPRTLLRYRPQVGAERRLEVTIDMELDAGGMGGPLPSLVMTLVVNVDALLPNGQAKLHATIEGVTARDQEASKVSAASLTSFLEPMKGITFDAVLAPDGRVTATTLDAKGTQLPSKVQIPLGSLVDSFAQTLMPLPDVPVGAGAVWRSSRPLTRNGIELTAVNSISLTSVTGTTFSYTLDSSLHGADQTASDSGSGSARVDVKGITGHGAGKGTVDLTTLAVTSELFAQLQAEMTSPGDVEPTKMEMATLSKVRPVD